MHITAFHRLPDINYYTVLQVGHGQQVTKRGSAQKGRGGGSSQRVIQHSIGSLYIDYYTVLQVGHGQQVTKRGSAQKGRGGGSSQRVIQHSIGSLTLIITLFSLTLIITLYYRWDMDNR